MDVTVDASITPRLRMSRNSSTRSDNPAAVLRALLSRLPAHTPSPTHSHALSVQGSAEQERESDFDTVSELNVATSIAQESLKHIFSNALSDASKKERIKNKVKRRSVSDDEVENTSQFTGIDRRDIRSKSTSPPITMEFLRERFSDSHSLDLLDRDSEMRNSKLIEGMWLNTPKSREGTEQGSPSDDSDATQSSGDTPRVTDDGLSYVKTPARAEATYGFRSSAKTPKPPGEWVSTPAPAPSIFGVNGLDDGDDGLQRMEELSSSSKSPPSPRRQKLPKSPSDDEVENTSQSIDRRDIRLKSTSPPTKEFLRECFSNSHSLEVMEQGSPSDDATQSSDTPLAADDSVSYVKTPARAEAAYCLRSSSKTPKPPGGWVSTPAPAPAPSIFGVNGLDDGDDGLQRIEELSSSSKSPPSPSPRRQKLPKSPSDDEVENTSQSIDRRDIRLKSTSPPISKEFLRECFSNSHSLDVTEQGSPSDDAIQSNGDTPRATDDGLSYVKTPARAEATYGFRSSAKTPKPPGGWVSTPAPAPSIFGVNGLYDSDDNLQRPEELSSKSPSSPRRQKSPGSPSDDEVENTSQSINRRDIRLKSTLPPTKEFLRKCFSNSHSLEVTEQGSTSDGATQSNDDTPLAADDGMSYVKTPARAEATYDFQSSAKTPKPPGGWLSAKKSTMKVRFEPEVSPLDDGDDSLQRTQELPSKSPLSPRRQKSTNFPKIRVLDAFGREQGSDLSNQERVNSSPSALRVVDAMGHEIDEVEDTEAAATPSRSTVSRGELLSRIRNGLDDLVVGIDDLDKDDQPLYIDHDRVQQLTTISSRARGLRERLYSQDDSSRSSDYSALKHESFMVPSQSKGLHIPDYPATLTYMVGVPHIYQSGSRTLAE